MDDPTEATYDELWDALAHATGLDRIDVLMELADRAHQQRDLPRVQSLLGEAESTAGEIQDGVQLAIIQFRQAEVALEERDLATARERFSTAAQGFLDTGGTIQAARTLLGLAETEQAAHNWPACREAATQSLRILASEDAPGLSGDACLLQARALYFLDREREALEAAGDAREHYRKGGYPQLVARVDDLAVSIHLWLGNLDDALELARGCLVLTRTADGRDSAPALVRLAEVHSRRGESAEALRAADLACEIHRAEGDLAGVAGCEMVRGDALYDLDRIEESLTAFIEARVLFDATGWDGEAVNARAKQAVILHRVGRYEEAARINRELVPLFASRTDSEVAVRWCVVRLLDNLLELGDHRGLLAAAQEHAGVWPADVGVDDRSYRECLGFQAAALAELGRADEAGALASQVIAATPARDASASTAMCYEIRGRLAGSDEAATRDFAHAIALHVARGNLGRARELSDRFLSRDDGDGKGFPGLR